MKLQSPQKGPNTSLVELQETAHLLASPVNAARLRQAKMEFEEKQWLEFDSVTDLDKFIRSQ